MRFKVSKEIRQVGEPTLISDIFDVQLGFHQELNGVVESVLVQVGNKCFVGCFFEKTTK